MSYKEQYKQIESDLIALRKQTKDEVDDAFWSKLGFIFDQLITYLEVTKPSDSNKILDMIATDFVEGVRRKENPTETIDLVIQLDAIAREQFGIRKFPSEMEVCVGGNVHNYLRELKDLYAEIIQTSTVHKLEEGIKLVLDELYSLNRLLSDEEVDLRSHKIYYLRKELEHGLDSGTYNWFHIEIEEKLREIETELTVNSLNRYKEDMAGIEKELLAIREAAGILTWDSLISKAVPLKDRLVKHLVAMRPHDLPYIYNGTLANFNTAVETINAGSVVRSLILLDVLCRSWVGARHLPTQMELEAGSDLHKYLDNILVAYNKVIDDSSWERDRTQLVLIVSEVIRLDWLLKEEGLSRKTVKLLYILEDVVNDEAVMNMVDFKKSLEKVLFELKDVIESKDGK